MARSRKSRKAAPKLARDKAGRWRYGGKFISAKRAKDVQRKRRQRKVKSGRPATVTFERKGQHESEFAWTVYDQTRLPGASKLAQGWERALAPLDGWRVRVTIVFRVRFPDSRGGAADEYTRSAEFTKFSYFDVFGHGAFLYEATKSVQEEVRATLGAKGSKDYERYVVNVKSLEFRPLSKR